MGTVASGAITLSEFESDAGELITLPLAKSLHSRIVRRVFKAIESCLKEDGFAV